MSLHRYIAGSTFPTKSDDTFDLVTDKHRGALRKKKEMTAGAKVRTVRFGLQFGHRFDLWPFERCSTPSVFCGLLSGVRELQKILRRAVAFSLRSRESSYP